MSVDKLVDSTQLDSDLTSVANAIRSKAGISVTLSFPADFVTEIGNITTGGNLETGSQTITATESSQSITMTPSTGYDGFDEVDITVNAIPSNYVGSGVTQRTSSDLNASGATVTAPAGYYASSASTAVASGTEGTPTASKGAVNSHSIAVTPSVTNTAGYISGGTKTGTAVSVSASELVSGTYSVTGSGTANVTNYASISVPSGSATTPATSVTATPSISVSSGGLITASVSTTKSVTPSVSAGYVASGTAGTITVNGSNTQQISDPNLIPENIKKDVVIFGITGTYEGDAPSGYTVTISLTNPAHASSFRDCQIYEALSNDVYDMGKNIGSILSATGSTEVSVDTSMYGIVVVASGTSVYTDLGMCNCTGDVSAEDTDFGGAILFGVTGNGTITIDGIDYSD